MTDREPDENGPEMEALRRALRTAYRGRVEVPPAVDEAIRARARLPFARIRRRRLLWLAVPAAAAAALALAVYLGAARDGGEAVNGADATVAWGGAAKAPGPQEDASVGTAEAPRTREERDGDARLRAGAPTTVADAAEPGDATPAAAAADTAALATEATLPPPDAAPRPRRGDVNGDGRVDILDAFVLAKAVEAGAAAGEWDLSGDGRVDRADVERVARAAVAVRGGGK